MASFQAYLHLHHDLPSQLEESVYEHFSIISQVRSDNNNVSYYCELCDTHLGTRSHVIRHCNEQYERSSAKVHRLRVKSVVEMRKNPVVLSCSALQRRMDGIGHQVKEARDMLYWVLLNSAGSPHSWKAEYQAQLAEVEELVDRYERLEQCHLLGLVAWKAVCISNPSSSAKSFLNDYHAWIEWARRGWKSAKDEMRHSNAIGVIVRSVRPFIEQPE